MSLWSVTTSARSLRAGLCRRPRPAAAGRPRPARAVELRQARRRARRASRRAGGRRRPRRVEAREAGGRRGPRGGLGQARPAAGERQREENRRAPARASHRPRAVEPGLEAAGARVEPGVGQVRVALGCTWPKKPSTEPSMSMPSLDLVDVVEAHVGLRRRRRSGRRGPASRPGRGRRLAGRRVDAVDEGARGARFAGSVRSSSDWNSIRLPPGRRPRRRTCRSCPAGR